MATEEGLQNHKRRMIRMKIQEIQKIAKNMVINKYHMKKTDYSKGRKQYGLLLYPPGGLLRRAFVFVAGRLSVVDQRYEL